MHQALSSLVYIILALIVILLLTSSSSSSSSAPPFSSFASAAGLPSALNFDNCHHHFYKGLPPSPRRENCTNTSCTDMCHEGHFATMQNLNLRAPEFAADFLTYDQAWLALANDFSRPSWKLSNAIGEDQQYALANDLWSGSSGPYDRGHLISKENLDYSKDAVDSTFDMTNVVPQLDSCNQRTWVQLEKDVRYWARGRNQSLYVVVHLGYRDYAKPPWDAGVVVPDFMIMALCDPNASTSLALIGETAGDKCGLRSDGSEMLYEYRTVRYAESNFLNGTKIFDEECRPCLMNNSHWFGSFTTRYKDGNSTPELCATEAPPTTSSTSTSTTATSSSTTSSTLTSTTSTTSLTTSTTSSTATSTSSSTTTSMLSTTTIISSSATTTLTSSPISSTTTATEPEPTTSSTMLTTSASTLTTTIPPPPTTTTTVITSSSEPAPTTSTTSTEPTLASTSTTTATSSSSAATSTTTTVTPMPSSSSSTVSPMSTSTTIESLDDADPNAAALQKQKEEEEERKARELNLILGITIPVGIILLIAILIFARKRHLKMKVASRVGGVHHGNTGVDLDRFDGSGAGASAAAHQTTNYQFNQENNYFENQEEEPPSMMRTSGSVANPDEEEVSIQHYFDNL